MNTKENKVLSEYFKKIEKAELDVLQSNDTNAIAYLLKNKKICDKNVNYLFQFGDKTHKMIFLDSRKKFTLAEQIAICTFGSTEMIKKLIGKLHTIDTLYPVVEKILLGPTKQAALYSYLAFGNRTLASENLPLFFQTADASLVKAYFQNNKCIPIDKPAFNELIKRGLGNLFIEHFDNCSPTKESLLAVFESDMEKLKTRIIQYGCLTILFDVDFIKKYGYTGLAQYPFPILSVESQRLLYKQDKDQYWSYCLTHKIHALLECQKELRTDKKREKLWLEWLKKGVVAECVLKDVILQEPQQLPLYIKYTPNISWDEARLIISLAPAPIAKEMAKNIAHPDCREIYKKRFNWFQRTFG
jgi:hypothetical protein